MDGGVVLRQHRAGVGVFLGLPLDAAGLAELRQRLLDAAVEAGDSGEEGADADHRYLRRISSTRAGSIG